MNKNTRIIIFCIFASMIFIGSCRQKTGLYEKPDSTQVTSPILAQTRRLPEIIFLDGDVSRTSGGNLMSAFIGDKLDDGDYLHTGSDGICEIAFKDSVRVRMLPESSIFIISSLLDENLSRANIGISKGTILCKAEKLFEKDSFEVYSDHAVSGVRGTEFIISRTDKDKTVVAVKEGIVKVLPRSKSIDAIVENAKTNLVARIMLETIVFLAPETKKNQVIEIGFDATRKIEEKASKILSEIESMEPVPSGPEQEFVSVIPAAATETRILDESLYMKIKTGTEKQFDIPIASPFQAGKEIQNLFKMMDETMTGFSKKSDSEEKITEIVVKPSFDENRDQLYQIYPVSGKKLSGSITRVPGEPVILCADISGGVYAISQDGNLIWSASSTNSNSGKNYPVTFKGYVYYSGDSEFLIMDSADGQIVTRQTLEPDRSHESGMHVIPFPNAMLFPTTYGFDVIDPLDGSVKQSIQINGGTGMTPASYEGKAVIVNNNGVFMIIDVAEGKILTEITTSASSPASMAPRIYGDKAVFVDNEGLVVLIDLIGKNVIWEKKISGPVSGDLEISNNGIFVFADSAIFGIGFDGNFIMDSVKNVSAPPLLSRGILYYGLNSGELIFAQTLPWKILKSIKLSEPITTRPLVSNGVVWAGTKTGKILKIPDPFTAN